LYDGDMGTKKMRLTVAAAKESWSVAKITQISGKSLCIKADTAQIARKLAASVGIWGTLGRHTTGDG
jgi:hypothetical protein